MNTANGTTQVYIYKHIILYTFFFFFCILAPPTNVYYYYNTGYPIDQYPIDKYRPPVYRHTKVGHIIIIKGFSSQRGYG